MADLVQESIKYFQDRLDALHLMLETLRAHQCFDEEDHQFVVDEIARLESQRDEDETRMHNLILSSQALEQREALLQQRKAVLIDIDNSSRVLERNKRLRDKFVKKHVELEAQVHKLRQEITKWAEPQ